MWKMKVSCVLLLLGYLLADARPGDLREEWARNNTRKIIRAESAAKQTRADRLRLPSNASSIRENITDTFSCEGRGYGYYADVDNDCQLFHVCLPTSSRSRNSSYRWSFICPQETVFNQEVLVCTRPQDSINCTDSAMYYDVNNDIGKVDDDTGSKPDYDNDVPVSEDDKPTNETPKEIQPANKRKPKPDRKKHAENIVEMLPNFVNTAVQNSKIEQIQQNLLNIEDVPAIDEEVRIKIGDTEDIKMNHDKDTEDVKLYAGNTEEMKMQTNRAERKIKNKSRRRGSFRFSADA